MCSTSEEREIYLFAVFTTFDGVLCVFRRFAACYTVFTFRCWLDLLGVVLAFWISIIG